MVEIKVMCRGSHEFRLDELHILQDTKDFCLKELSQFKFEQLKKRIIKKGFWFPFFVWHCKAEDRWYYTDGTQRHKVLTWMQERPTEFKLPEKFPASEIFAKNKKEAAEAILTQSAKYGEITEDGLYGFLNEFELLPDFGMLKTELTLPEFDLSQFEAGYLKDSEFEIVKNNPENLWQGMPEFDNLENKPYRTIYVHFDNEDAVNNFKELIKQTITEKTKYIWYPKKESLDLINYRVKDES